MWTCPECNESIEDNFEVCWNCKTSKDGVPPDDLVPDALPKELEALRELMSKSPDEHLRRIVSVDFEQYGEEVLLLAQDELDRRYRPVLQPEPSVIRMEDEQSRQRISLNKKPIEANRSQLAAGIVIALIGVGLIVISPSMVFRERGPRTQFDPWGMEERITDLTNVTKVFGVAILIVGGVISAAKDTLDG